MSEKLKDAFAKNTKLQCVDFANCKKENVLTQSNIADLGLSQYALVYAPENFTATNLTNVVYGSNGDLKCDHLALSDSADYIVTREFKAAEISYDRVFEKGKASTLCLPFDMELPSNAKAYMLTEKDGDVLVFSQVKNIIANNPYIVVVDEDMTFSINTETLAPVTPKNLSQVEVDNFVMSGSLTSISENEAIAQSIYAMNDVACWNLVTTTEEGKKVVYPYHAFIRATKSDMPNNLQVRFVDGTTGVDNIEMTNEQKTDYIGIR